MASPIGKLHEAGLPLPQTSLPPRAKAKIEQSPSCEQYTVAWIAAMPIDLASAMVMLDKVFEDPKHFKQPSTDSNIYTYGSIGKHNVVIASLPIYSYYTAAAAITTQLLISSFPNVRLSLMVGTGGAIPKPDYDIRLGDIVIAGAGVFQHDRGKKEKNDTWVSKSELAKPPEILRKALSKLVALNEQARLEYLHILDAAMDENQSWAMAYKYPVGAEDQLFESDYNHAGEASNCSECDQSKEIQRSERISARPYLHIGIVASGNVVVKDSLTRDVIGSRKADCICLEMEAAGLMYSFPSLTIRGISNYADSHKNDTWQRYASATAAAITKELLNLVPLVRSATKTFQPEAVKPTEATFLSSLDSCD